MICTHCGHQNPAGANFCSSCGKSLAQPVDDATITFHVADLGILEQDEEDLSHQVGALAPADAMLYVKRGSTVGATYLLDTDVTRVGRHPDSEVFLDDVTVSRRHAEFRREGGQFVIQDVGSLNGTYVNGRPTERAVLRRGDEVQIGKFKLVFVTSSDH